MKFNNIETKRLLLRQFKLSDAKLVREYAGEREVAKTTLNIPYPYEKGIAEHWIRTHKENFKNRLSVIFAITHKEEKHLIGAVGLELNNNYDHAELGYWIAKKYWNMGYCTEASEGVLKYGFNELGLNRIYARHLGINPASGKVMIKIGMHYEGLLRQHVKKWDEYHDIVYYGILKNDFIKS